MERTFGTIWLKNVDSTNNEAFRRIDSLDNMSVLSAECQFEGRGQRGNTWFAAPGENITASIILKNPEKALPAAKDFFQLNILSSVAVVKYLQQLGIAAKIKWPNDIYAGGKKISGMLIENSFSGKDIGTSVIGIGVNINQTNFDNVANATSVKLLSNRSLCVKDELESMLREFGRAMDTDRTELKEYYFAHLFGLGEIREYRNMKSGEVFQGRICGVGDDGCLEIESGETIFRFAFKEVSFIL